MKLGLLLAFLSSTAFSGEVLLNGVWLKSPRVVSVVNGKVTLEAAEGSGVVPISSLSGDTLAEAKRVEKETAALAAERARLMKQLEAEAKKGDAVLAEIDARFAATREKLAPLVKAGGMLIHGRVLQKATDGLLIDPTEPSLQTKTESLGVAQYDKVALLKGHPRFEHWVDDDLVASFAVFDGTFSFLDAGGVKRTVRSFKWVENPLRPTAKK